MYVMNRMGGSRVVQGQFLPLLSVAASRSIEWSIDGPTAVRAHMTIPIQAKIHGPAERQTQASPRRTQEQCLESIVLLTAQGNCCPPGGLPNPSDHPQRASTTPDPARYPYPMTTHPPCRCCLGACLGLDPPRAAPTEGPAASIRMSVRVNGLESGVRCERYRGLGRVGAPVALGGKVPAVRSYEAKQEARRGGRDGPLIGMRPVIGRGIFDCMSKSQSNRIQSIN